MIRGRFNVSDSSYVRNFGTDLLKGSLLEEDGGDIVAIGGVQKNGVLLNLVKWDSATGVLIPLQGLSKNMLKIERNDSKGHIRDIAWAPKNIYFSRGSQSIFRVLAVVTDQSLLVLEVEFADSNTVSGYHLVYNIDVDKSISTNSEDAKLMQATGICSKCVHICWILCAIPTLFLFRSNAPPIRVTLTSSHASSDGTSLQRDDAEVLVLNIRSASSDAPIVISGGIISGSSLIANGENLGIVKCETPMVEKARSKRSRTSHTPAHPASACRAEFMCESNGIVAALYSSEYKGQERPTLDLGDSNTAPVSSFLAATSPRGGKFRHVLAGESILSALSVTARQEEDREIGILEAGVTRRMNMGKGVLWREDTATSVLQPAEDRRLELDNRGGGALSTLLNISQTQHRAGERGGTVAEEMTQNGVAARTACATGQRSSSRLRVLNFGEGEGGEGVPIVTDAPFASGQAPDMGCLLLATDGSSLYFACAGRRAREVSISRVNLRDRDGGGGGEREGTQTHPIEVLLPDGMTARGLSMRWGDSQHEKDLDLLVLAVARVDAPSSLASFGAAANVNMSLLSYRIGDLDKRYTGSGVQIAESDSDDGSLVEGADQVLIAAAASHHVSRLSSVSERRKMMVEQGRASELVCACCVEPGIDADGAIYCLNVGALPPTSAAPAPKHADEDGVGATGGLTMGMDNLQLRELLHAFSAPIVKELESQSEAIASLDRRMRRVEEVTETLHRNSKRQYEAGGGNVSIRRRERAIKEGNEHTKNLKKNTGSLGSV